MTLAAETKIGPYEIVAPLGAGGMGEVYRARDTKLNREVALKVLPAAFANDAERMARFEREAQVLASLNHPNIASIYGLEESGGVRALVMELVEGPTLAERLGGSVAPVSPPAIVSRKTKGAGEDTGATTGASIQGERRSPLQLEEALPIAKQIAEALEAAHERGIIHRDLKPANVKVTHEGVVKVLDFGLAKALAPEDSGTNISNSPTISIAATQAGMILGTAAYMSPEQAKGKSVDRRADIWAFGCVLYEMLTGKKTFEGETTSDVLAAVIRAEPEWHELPQNTPPSIQKLLRRCLEKDSKRRLQAIGEARIAIEETLSGTTDVGAAVYDRREEEKIGGHRPPLQRALPWALAAAMLIVGFVAGWWLKARHSPSVPDWSAQMLGGPSIAFGARISPDGHTLAFQAMVDGTTQVAVMDTESGDWTVLTKNRSRGYVTELNWSLDGTEIYFDREFSGPRGIYTVSRFGGEERLILEDAMGPEVLLDGSLLITRVNKDRDFQLNRFWPESGRLVPLNGIFISLDLCPPVRAFRDGKEAVFFGKTPDQVKTDPVPHLYVIDLTSGKTRRLAPELDLVPSAISLFPLAVSIDDQSVLIDSREGDLHRIVAVPRSGSGPIRTLLSLTAPPLFMDVGKDGTLYLDQTVRPNEILRSSALGGTPEVLAGSETPLSGAQSTFQIADGRVLLDSIVAGRSRLLLAMPGGDSVPFIATKEETSGPACRVGEGEVAFLLGPHGNAVVAIASIAEGRIVRRLKGVQGTGVGNLIASRDGTTLYYVVSGSVWAIPATDGQPRRIGPGDAVAIDPNGKDLIVQFREKEGVRLARVPISGGTPGPIPIQSALRLAPVEFGTNAIGKDGRALVSIATPDNWFYGAGILDLRSGRLTRIPLNFIGDLLGLGWQDDGRILSTGWPLKATLWRFRLAALEKK
ncbi:MAG TPA: protein kinase [Terriglobia bacterium]|nr:protein kinase [Terriglobia bacterium]